MNIPEQLKPISQYIRKAEELDKDSTNPDSRVVAYCCRFYAVDKAIKMKLKIPEVSVFLQETMGNLEKNKVTLTTDERKLVCERFAFKVFSIADDEDRAGVATKKTAQTFHAAATFFDILEQFGDLESDVSDSRPNIFLCFEFTYHRLLKSASMPSLKSLIFFVR
jgi:vacuolar protein sorting-associated protein VTA1